MDVSLKKRVIKWSVCVLILIVALGIRIQKQSEKKFLFGDEHLSYILATINTLGWGEDVTDDSTKLVSDDLYKAYFKVDPSFGSVIKQVIQLRENTRDQPHPNLYYSLLRISLWGVDKDNPDDMVERGFFLNLVIFLFSFLLLYKLASRLFKNDILVLCALGVAFLNPAAVANTLFLRPYQMQEAIFLLFTYISVFYYCKVIDGVSFNKWKFVLLYGFVTSLVLLTGYFSIPYVILLVLLFVFFIIKFSSKKDSLLLIVSTALSYVFALVIYPNYNGGFTSNRSTEALDKLGIDVFIENMGDSFGGLFSEVNKYFWDIFVVGLIAIILILAIVTYKKQSTNNRQDYKSAIPLFLFACGLLWIIAVFYLAPYKLIRYILPVLAIVSLIIPYLLSFVKEKYQIIFSCLFVVYFTFKTLMSHDIFLNKQPFDEIFIGEKSTPLVVAAAKGWNQDVIIPYYNVSRRSVEFTFDTINFKNKVNQYNELFLFIPVDSVSKYRLPDNYFVQKEMQSPIELKMYKVKRRE